jgi:hypothetical protein
MHAFHFPSHRFQGQLTLGDVHLAAADSILWDKLARFRDAGYVCFEVISPARLTNIFSSRKAAALTVLLYDHSKACIRD